MTHQNGGQEGERGGNTSYTIDFDGVEKKWPNNAITLSELRTLGGIGSDAQVVLIDADENEKPIEEGAVITLEPGHRFGKKVKWRRG